MKRTRSGPENEFFLAGATTYLDVQNAITEFSRQVQDRCRDVLRHIHCKQQ